MGGEGGMEGEERGRVACLAVARCGEEVTRGIPRGERWLKERGI